MKKDPAKGIEDKELLKIIADYGDIQSYSDRDTVLVLSSIIEELLERILMKSLCIPNKELREQLFQFNGPLGTFSNKNSMAFSIGKISRDVYEDINILRQLRNECAHNIIQDEIDSQQFTESILPKFRILNNSKQKDIKAVEKGATNRYRLIIEVEFLGLVLASTLRSSVPFLSPETHDKNIVDNATNVFSSLVELMLSSKRGSNTPPKSSPLL